MDFKSTHIVLTLVTGFSCFASQNVNCINADDQKLLYNREGINAIAKVTFHKEDNTLSKQLCFLEGFRTFCKEQEIRENAVIAKIITIPQTKIAKNETISVQSLHLTHPCLPMGYLTNIYKTSAGSTEITSFHSSKTVNEFSRLIAMTPEMKKFVQDMIEKGKSVNQNK